jgi:SNF2 family DNA or RNA helicase
LGELLALLRFLMPDLFGSSEDINDEVILGQELEGAAKDEQVQPGKTGGRVEE